ncbi:MAG: PQQ-binding-like beta-propeller repeat protein [Planctomycetaceae bacterium]|nr:PQQ-binding-like beta-propeller repeat protein [Planctomycetaceae bacterium]
MPQRPTSPSRRAFDQSPSARWSLRRRQPRQKPARSFVRGSVALAVLLSAGLTPCSGSDWTRFRGENGSGIAADAGSIPTSWGEDQNLKWKCELPGPGASSPIVVGDRVFVTSWSGYADGSDAEGDLENLKRHLVCVDRASGKILWKSTVDATLPEDSFRGMFAENGYATHTPVSDGKRVFAFFGKSGVKAYDLNGTQLWEAMVGEERDGRGWGTASSPILYKNLLIVTASIEDRAIVALDTETGKQVWKQQANGLESTWGTPILVQAGDQTDLVIAVPYEVWGLNPDTGKLRWYCEAIDSNSMCSSVVADGDVVYAIESGPGGGGSVAIRTGGKGDVTDRNILWKGSDRSRIGTPVVHEGRMYWISSGVANCVDAKTGEEIYKARLSGGGGSGGENANEGGRGGRGGGRGGQDYSSPIIADGKLIFCRRSGDTYVIKAGPEFEQLAVNRFSSSEGDFSATPAAADGQLFIRSSKTLYCVSAN